MIREEIGKNIKKARQSKGFTMQSLADKIGISRVSITRFESGKENLTIDTIQKLADAIGVHITDILCKK